MVYIEAKNMLISSISETKYLPVVMVKPELLIYTHNPMFPRYFVWVLMNIGIMDIKWHNLILCLMAMIGSLFFIYYLFKDKMNISIFLIFFLVFDFFTILQNSTNMFRAWHVFLFFGCLLSIKSSSKPIYSFLIFFVLFQFEYVFAVFVLLMSSITVILDHIFHLHQNSWRNFIYALSGTITSLLLFAFQLIAYYGIKAFVHDLAYTFTIRNSNASIPIDRALDFYESNNVLGNYYGSPAKLGIVMKDLWKMLSVFYSITARTELLISLMFLFFFCI